RLSLCSVVCVVCYWLCFFFFSSRRRHTRSYGDWSSDVCSSDLEASRGKYHELSALGAWGSQLRGLAHGEIVGTQSGAGKRLAARSEERRVGKECRSRWWAER